VPGRGARGQPEAPAGNEPPSAGLDAAGQGAASHLVIQEVTGQAGQAGGLIDAVRQPFGRWIWSWRARHPPAGIWWFRSRRRRGWCNPPAIMHCGVANGRSRSGPKVSYGMRAAPGERFRGAGRRRTAGGSRRLCGRGRPGHSCAACRLSGSPGSPSLAPWRTPATSASRSARPAASSRSSATAAASSAAVSSRHRA